jgi:hypothetical protein
MRSKASLPDQGSICSGDGAPAESPLFPAEQILLERELPLYTRAGRRLWFLLRHGDHEHAIGQKSGTCFECGVSCNFDHREGVKKA